MNKHRLWLTVEAAAGFLTEKLFEPFTPADVYLQAIEGNLTLSLNLLDSVAVCKVLLRPGRIEENVISVSSLTDGRPAKYWGKFTRAEKIVEYAHVQDNAVQFFNGVHDVLPKGLVRTEFKQLLCQNLGVSLSKLTPEHFPGCIFDAGEQGSSSYVGLDILMQK